MGSSNKSSKVKYLDSSRTKEQKKDHYLLRVINKSPGIVRSMQENTEVSTVTMEQPEDIPEVEVEEKNVTCTPKEPSTLSSRYLETTYSPFEQGKYNFRIGGNGTEEWSSWN